MKQTGKNVCVVTSSVTADCDCTARQMVTVLTVQAIDTRWYGSYVTNIDSQCCNIVRFRSAHKWLRNLYTDNSGY